MRRVSKAVPPCSELTLYNIHVHANAEHKGGEFTSSVGATNLRPQVQNQTLLH